LFYLLWVDHVCELCIVEGSAGFLGAPLSGLVSDWIFVWTTKDLSIMYVLIRL
jgi:hypothetical protein